MCGIAGILNTGGIAPDLEVQLQTMQEKIRRRGPDDRGLWISRDRIAALAHTRLSIIDLSPAGHQPMLSPDGRLAITFNGEIYNYRELRDELIKDGFTFNTHSDTEVLLRLYERDGAGMVSRLRGMFAFAIWDEHTRSAFLARDPLGIKPLYYTMKEGRIAFASELRALIKARLTSRELDSPGLMRYFKTGTVAEPQTLLHDAFCLEAGHTLTWTADGRLKKQAYWNIEFNPSPCSAAEAAATVREALLDSVRAHFVSDVPVGIFLSGGIDSTALVALAREVGQKNIATFAIGVDDTVLDESNVARRTAGHFGTEHHEMHLNGDLAEQSFAEFLASMDQPSIDGLNTFTVSSFARQNQMKVVLSGLGGDEMFGGYPSFQQVPKLRNLCAIARTLPFVANAAGHLLERHAPSHRARRFAAFLQQDATIANAYRAFRGIFSSREAQILSAQFTGASISKIATPPMPEPRAYDDLDAVSECELTLYMRNQLLKDSDIMSMAHGLELRVPFVDRVLFETISRIPASLRLRQGKQMILDAVPEIPEWVANQPKRGFVFPFTKWLDAKWGEAFRDSAAKIPFANPTWYQRWSVFMLSEWMKNLDA